MADVKKMESSDKKVVNSEGVKKEAKTVVQAKTIQPKQVVQKKVVSTKSVQPVRQSSGSQGRKPTTTSRPIHNNPQNNPQTGEPIDGFLEMTPDGQGVLRPQFSPSDFDTYIPSSVIRRLGLRRGDSVEGTARPRRDNEKYMGLMSVTKVNGGSPNANLKGRVKFHNLTPIYPIEKIKTETGITPLSTRLIDLVAPIGKGQRGMVVSPPKAGKTTMMKEVITGVAKNYPEIHLMAVLIGERPEEVTDIRRHIERVTKDSEIPGECAASNFDEPAEHQTKVAEIALERAKRLVETGKDVMIVLDSITRLARAYNLAIPTSGRTLSGGFDPAALYPPKRFFGAARKMEGGGSLTILGTALVDTGSRMDELVYEEFKGTGNMELHLDRKLANRRVYPAIDVINSSTRNEDLLFTNSEYQSVVLLRRMIDIVNQGNGGGDSLGYVQDLINKLQKTKSNKEFLASLKEG